MDERIIMQSHLIYDRSPFADLKRTVGVKNDIARHGSHQTVPPISLDENLSSLFQCLRLEYERGKFLVSPKWKNFRSQSLPFSEKTRLNNAIWRCWHIQYLKGKRPSFCQFSTSISDDLEPPKKPFSVVLEGRYWRRRLEAVSREYKKCRVYYKRRLSSASTSVPLQQLSAEAQLADLELAQRLQQRELARARTNGSKGLSEGGLGYVEPTSPDYQEMSPSIDQDFMLSFLPDTLFTSNQLDGMQGAVNMATFMNRDMMQPTLNSLHPNLEEFMEHFESTTRAWTGQTDQKLAPVPEQGVLDPNPPASAAQPFCAALPVPDFGRAGVTQQQIEVMDESEDFSSAAIAQEFMDTSSGYPAAMSYAAGFAGELGAEQALYAPQPPQADAAVVLQTSPLSASPLQQSPLGSPLLSPSSAVSPVQQQPPQQAFAAAKPPAEATVFQVGGQFPETQFARGATPKGRIPRNVSDSQLYGVDSSRVVSPLVGSHTTNLLPSMESDLPPQLQAPNLAAHLQSTIPPRTRSLAATGAAAQPKRARLPRNKSDSRLSSLASRSGSSATVASESGQLPAHGQGSGASHVTRQASAKARRGGKLPRNMSDSSLMYLGQQQAQQEQAAFPPAIASSSSALSPRRRKLSDSDVGSVAQAMSAAPFPVSGPSLLPQAGSTRPVASSATAAQILEQLIQTSGFDGSMVASPAISAPQAVPAASATHASLLGQVLSQEARGLGRTAAKQDADTQEISKQILQLLHAQQRQQQQLQQQQEQLAQEQQRQLQQQQQPPSALLSLLQPGASQTPPVPANSSTFQQFAAQPLQLLHQLPVPATTSTTSAASSSQLAKQIAPNILPAVFPSTQALPVQAPFPDLQPFVVVQGGAGASAVAGAGGQQLRSLSSAAVGPPTASQLSALLLASQKQASVTAAPFPSIPSHTVTSAMSASSRVSPIAVSTVAAATPSQETVSVKSPDTSRADAVPTPATSASSKPSRPSRPGGNKEHRRITHITAEQKRRGNIKMGFDQLMTLVPTLAHQKNLKVSKATVLQKTVEYTMRLQKERQASQDEAESLRRQILELNSSISLCQQQLPATGAPVYRQHGDEMWALFNQYIKNRTRENYKFWIFGVIVRQLFEAFNNTVSTASAEQFFGTVLSWLEQHCTLPALRPAVLSSLRDLSRVTSILTDPSKVPEQAQRAALADDPTNLNPGAAAASGGAAASGFAGASGNKGGAPFLR